LFYFHQISSTNEAVKAFLGESVRKPPTTIKLEKKKRTDVIGMKQKTKKK